MSWTGPASFGSADASLTSASGDRYRLFSTSTEIGRRSGLRRAVRPQADPRSSRPSSPPRTRRRRSRRASATTPKTAPRPSRRNRSGRSPSRARRVVYVPRWRVGSRILPFVTGGGGYLRQLHEGDTLAETGRIYYVGGGARSRWCRAGVPGGNRVRHPRRCPGALPNRRRHARRGTARLAGGDSRRVRAVLDFRSRLHRRSHRVLQVDVLTTEHTELHRGRTSESFLGVLGDSAVSTVDIETDADDSYGRGASDRVVRSTFFEDCPMPSLNSFGTRTTMHVGAGPVQIYSLKVLEAAGFPEVARLPFSLKILLENLLRYENGASVKAADIEALARWNVKSTAAREISFMPARVLLQDFTGVPCVVDLAAMRDGIVRLGGDPEPGQPAATGRARHRSLRAGGCCRPRRCVPAERRSRILAQQGALRVPALGPERVSQLPRRPARHRHRPPGEPRIPGARGRVE